MASNRLRYRLRLLFLIWSVIIITALAIPDVPWGLRVLAFMGLPGLWVSTWLFRTGHENAAVFCGFGIAMLMGFLISPGVTLISILVIVAIGWIYKSIQEEDSGWGYTNLRQGGYLRQGGFGQGHTNLRQGGSRRGFRPASLGSRLSKHFGELAQQKAAKPAFRRPDVTTETKQQRPPNLGPQQAEVAAETGPQQVRGRGGNHTAKAPQLEAPAGRGCRGNHTARDPRRGAPAVRGRR